VRLLSLRFPILFIIKTINVQLEQYQNGVFRKRLNLVKVDGNLEGYVKDTGIFANAPNYLYKTKETLDQTQQL
jgi:hypothetical protein